MSTAEVKKRRSVWARIHNKQTPDNPIYEIHFEQGIGYSEVEKRFKLTLSKTTKVKSKRQN